MGTIPIKSGICHGISQMKPRFLAQNAWERLRKSKNQWCELSHRNVIPKCRQREACHSLSIEQSVSSAPRGAIEFGDKDQSPVPSLQCTKPGFCLEWLRLLSHPASAPNLHSCFNQHSAVLISFCFRFGGAIADVSIAWQNSCKGR